MSFDSFSDFLAMGGHGPYVWSVYAVALGVVLLIITGPLRRRRRFFREQAARARRDAASVAPASGVTPTAIDHGPESEAS